MTSSVIVAGSNVLTRRRLSSSLADLRMRGSGGDRLAAATAATLLLPSSPRTPATASSAGVSPDPREWQKIRPRRRARRRLLSWDEIPTWQQHGSEFIQTGYRKTSSSIRDCFASWLYLHNETVNIHSHVIGALIFFALPFYVFATEVPPRFSVATWDDIVVCSTYFLGVAICFTLSFAFHTLHAHSPSASRLGMKLDVQGILVLMWSSTVPLIYYSFAPPLPPSGSSSTTTPVVDEFAFLRHTYLCVTTVLAAACSAATFLPSLSGPAMGAYRAVLFFAFGASSFLFPIAHGMVVRGGLGGGGDGIGVREHSSRIGLPWVLLTAACNMVGFLAYTLRIPERWFPRRFDIFGASHQIMHVMVVAAALAFAGAVVQAFDARHFSDDRLLLATKG